MYHLSQYEIEKLADAIVARMPVQDEILSIKQVAAMLDTTDAAVRQKINRGTLPKPHKRGNMMYFSRNELTRWMLDDDYCINN